MESLLYQTYLRKGCDRMSYLYINENGVTIGIRENCIKASYKDGMTRSVPIETLESIQIFGNAQLTSQCLLECLQLR